MKRKNSFHILRVKIWSETPDPKLEKREWRGEVQRIETGETSYFRKLHGFPEAVQKLGILED